MKNNYAFTKNYILSRILLICVNTYYINLNHSDFITSSYIIYNQLILDKPYMKEDFQTIFLPHYSIFKEQYSYF